MNQTAEYTPTQPLYYNSLYVKAAYTTTIPLCLIKLLTFFMMLQCSEDLPQELLFTTVYLKCRDAQAHDANHYVNGYGLLKPLPVQENPLRENCG